MPAKETLLHLKMNRCVDYLLLMPGADGIDLDSEGGGGAVDHQHEQHPLSVQHHSGLKHDHIFQYKFITSK